MTVSAIEVRRLTPADAEDFVALRRRALQEEPLAFGSSPEDDRASDVGVVRSRLASPGGPAIFGAFASRLVGAVGIYREEQRKRCHKAQIWGMYVIPERRRSGAGQALLQAAIAHARTLPGLVQVQLSVTDEAAAARRLYERIGFKRWGAEEAALCHEGRLVSETHMAFFLFEEGH